MGFFDIHFKRNKEAGSIGIIGGVDGPISIFTISDEECKQKKAEQEKFLAYAASKIIPCDRTFEQIEQYLIERHQAVPHTLLPRELVILKANVIMNHFGDVLEKPAPLSDNPTREELLDYCKNDTSFLQAREYPADKFGLEFKAYRLPNEKSVIRKRKKTIFQKEPATNMASFGEDAVIVEMEMRTETLCINNGGEKVMEDLTLWRGVSENDIQERSPRFMAYAYALKASGGI